MATYQVTEEREETTTLLIVPHFDFVVVATTHKHRLRLVEVNATHRPVVLVKTVDAGAHPIVPQLD